MSVHFWETFLTELQQFNPTKWNDMPLSFLYPQLLTDSKELMKTCYSELLQWKCIVSLADVGTAAHT